MALNPVSLTVPDALRTTSPLGNATTTLAHNITTSPTYVSPLPVRATESGGTPSPSPIAGLQGRRNIVLPVEFGSRGIRRSQGIHAYGA